MAETTHTPLLQRFCRGLEEASYSDRLPYPPIEGGLSDPPSVVALTNCLLPSESVRTPDISVWYSTALHFSTVAIEQYTQAKNTERATKGQTTQSVLRTSGQRYQVGWEATKTFFAEAMHHLPPIASGLITGYQHERMLLPAVVLTQFSDFIAKELNLYTDTGISDMTDVMKELCSRVAQGNIPPKRDTKDEFPAYERGVIRLLHGIYSGINPQVLPLVLAHISPPNNEVRLHQTHDPLTISRYAKILQPIGITEAHIRRSLQDPTYERWSRTLNNLPSEEKAKRSKLHMQDIEAIKSLRRIINAVLSDEIKWGHLAALNFVAFREQPLGRLAEIVAAENPDLPTHRRLGRQGVRQAIYTAEDDPETLESLAFLRETAAYLGLDERSIVKPNKANLGGDYHVLLIPDVQDNGTVLWHAIADFKTIDGNHAVYVWNAHLGVDSQGNIHRTWEEVFDQIHRQDALAMGAFRVLHTRDENGEITDDYKDRVFDHLTAPPSILSGRIIKRTVRLSA